MIFSSVAGPHLELGVADTGEGVAAGDRERIFQRFARGTSALRNRSDGSGLGLAIVAAHGGSVEYADTPIRRAAVPCSSSAFHLEPPHGTNLDRRGRDRIVSFLSKGLEANGHATLSVGDGVTGAALVRDDDFDLVILDVGPDDYVVKPFRFEELLARVRARPRDQGTSEATMLTVGGVTLDLRRRSVSANGRSIDLSAREFALAEVLFRHPDQVLAREQLLSMVWGYDFEPGSNVVDVYVGLRRKLGGAVIETVRGMGYCLSTSDGKPRR